MAAEKSSAIRRRRLRTELRRAREAVNLTQEQVTQEMEWSLSKLIRIETGAVGVSANDLKALLALYGVDDPERVRELKELARASRRRPEWWSIYRDLINEPYGRYMEMEAAASLVRQYQPLLVPGLLQTEEYARAIMKSGGPMDLSDEKAARYVDLRLTRQRELFSHEQYRVNALLGEASVRQIVGGPEVARNQLTALVEGRHPGVTVRVVPFGAGAHPGLTTGGFVILEFSDPMDDDVLCLEAAHDDIIERDHPVTVARYRNAFSKLEKLALSREKTTLLLKRLIDDIS